MDLIKMYTKLDNRVRNSGGKLPATAWAIASIASTANRFSYPLDDSAAAILYVGFGILFACGSLAYYYDP